MKRINQSIPHSKTLQSVIDKILLSDLSEYVSYIYLFGSIARKHFTAKSDIDLLIEFDECITSNCKYKEQIEELKNNIRNSINYYIEIDILVEIGKEWEKDNNTFYNSIKHDKKTIYSKKGGVNYEF